MEYLDISLHGLDKQGNEKDFKLRDFLGQVVVLYFYPKDNTSGCTLQAQYLRDRQAEFVDKAIIVGVSPDDIKSHHKFFCNQNLNFILLSDTQKVLAQNFGVWVEKSMYGKKYMGILRSSFILDIDGNIIKEFRNVKPAQHAQQVLDFLQKKI
ncbi:MAG: peroxiredoxin [Firmicutes bacterium]|nr:peroxiredoxin [Bacillota bacterium]MCL1953811.1 peroxiredoxin [Bacillota bacterium]